MTSDPYMPDPADAESDDVIELEADLMDTRAEDDIEPDDSAALEESVGLDEPVDEIAGLDAVVDALVETANARDVDAISDLVVPDVEVPFLGAVSAESALEAFGDLLLRYPTLILTRGDLGHLPVAAAWLFDQEHECYEMVGHLLVELSDTDVERIQRIDYVDEPDDPDELLVERPEADELPEWGDWTRQDEG